MKPLQTWRNDRSILSCQAIRCLGSQQGRQRSITRVNPSAQLASASSSIRRESNIYKARGLVKANSHKPLQGRGQQNIRSALHATDTNQWRLWLYVGPSLLQSNGTTKQIHWCQLIYKTNLTCNLNTSASLLHVSARHTAIIRACTWLRYLVAFINQFLYNARNV